MLGKFSWQLCTNDCISWYAEGSEVPPFKSGPPSSLGLPSNSGLQGAPFSLSVLHMIPWNSPNSEMDEGHIWVWSTAQLSRKQNASNREDFKQ